MGPTDAEGRIQANPTPIDNCGTIDEPGVYVLTDDITQGGDGGGFTFASQTCLLVESDDVVLDGQGHTVDALGNSDTTGITVGGANASVEDVTVTNVTVTDWNRGVYFRNSDGGTLRDATVADNAFGVMIERSSGTSLVRSRVEDNLLGVYEGADAGDTSFSSMSYEGNYAGDVVSDTAAENGTADARAPSDGRPTNTTTTTTTAAATTSTDESG